MEKNAIPHGARASIRSFYNSLSHTEKLVADYVLANAEMVVYQPLEKVAEAVHVSDATVLRFARSVGFSGFPELKMGLLVDFVAPVKSISLEIDSEDDSGIVLQKVFEQNGQTLQEIIPLIEQESFQNAVNLLANARNTYLFAIGTSVPLIFSFHNLLVRLGLKVSLITDPYTQILQAAVLNEQDLVVIISRSGVPLTHPILYRAAKRSGAQILCVTTDPKKPYAKYTEHILLVPSSENINVSPPTSPVLMVVFEALYTALLLRFRERAIELQNRISEALMETLVEDKNIQDEDNMRTVYWEDESIMLVDQTALPGRYEQIKVTTIERLARAIYLLEVRGAPAIGVSAAFGLALAARQSKAADATGLMADIQTAHDVLAKTRPTAVNLFWALSRMMKFAQAHLADWKNLPQLLLDEAQRMADEDVSINKRMALYGAELISDGAVIMTHCNCGPLCTVDVGTAMGPVILAHQQGKKIHVFTDETRPLLQGARLNAWELANAGVPYTLITDNTAAWIMQTRKKIDMVMIGVDRVAANGDTAAKIGVYGLAVLAKYHGIPFYAVSPLSTIDMTLKTGKEIPIETRDPDEVRKVMGNYITMPDANVENYAFDVTPHELIAGIVTEFGICKPPYEESFKQAFAQLEQQA